MHSMQGKGGYQFHIKTVKYFFCEIKETKFIVYHLMNNQCTIHDKQYIIIVIIILSTANVNAIKGRRH